MIWITFALIIPFMNISGLNVVKNVSPSKASVFIHLAFCGHFFEFYSPLIFIQTA